MTIYPPNPEEKPHPELRTPAMMIYMIAGMSGVLQLYESTVILGLILLVIAWFLNRTQKILAKGTIYESHAEWTARTLSFGTFVIFPIALAISAWLIWKNTDVESIRTAMNSDDMDAPMKAAQNYMIKSKPYIYHTSVYTMILPVLWWVRRCVSGFLRAKRGEQMDYPWLWL